ncbi:MAG: hypothetical protein WD208_03055 [Dehalococcoidia bacterium]
MRHRSKPLLIMLLLIAALAVLSACAGEPSADATPESSPTPAPIEPINIGPDEDPEAFLAALPPSELECAETAVGGHEQLISLLNQQGAHPDQDQALQLAECVSAETVARVLTGQLENMSAPLSIDTRQCISEKVSGTSISALIGSDSEPDPGAAIGFMQAIFCLNSAERAALEASGEGFAPIGGDVGIDELECLADAVGPTRLAAAAGLFLGQGNSDDLLPSEFINEMTACGLITEEDLAKTQLTAEQLDCLFTELGDKVAGLMSGQQPDSGDMSDFMAALSKCGVEPEGFMNGNGGDMNLPGGELEDFDLPFTAEEIKCLENEVNPETLAALAGGEFPPPDAFDALSKCEIDLSNLAGG